MDKFTVRRKILRGSLSAPVILTVASPGSLAAASTTCLVNTDQANPPPLFVGQRDAYQRTSVTVCEYEATDGTFDEFYEDMNGTLRSVTNGNEITPGSVRTDKQCETKEALVYVNSQGTPVWYGHPSTKAGGSFTSIGCWNSLLIRP